MNPRVIYTAGVFDLLHRGHLNLLWASRKLGDVLVVGVVSDSGVRAYKGRMPMQNIQQRMAAVARLSFVDVVVMQPSTDPTPVLERIRPDVMTHGDDWDRLREGHETLERLGIAWRLISYTPDVSTTKLREEGLIVPAPTWDAPDYRKMEMSQLEEIAFVRGVEINGTGTNRIPTKDDLVTALERADREAA